jgi:hypothetical protein
VVQNSKGNFFLSFSYNFYKLKIQWNFDCAKIHMLNYWGWDTLNHGLHSNYSQYVIISKMCRWLWMLSWWLKEAANAVPQYLLGKIERNLSKSLADSKRVINTMVSYWLFSLSLQMLKETHSSQDDMNKYRKQIW